MITHKLSYATLENLKEGETYYIKVVYTGDMTFEIVEDYNAVIMYILYPNDGYDRQGIPNLEMYLNAVYQENK